MVVQVLLFVQSDGTMGDMVYVKRIESFSGENRFLSNFWPVEVELEGEIYPSTEQAYKAAKTSDLDARKKIAGLVPNKRELEDQIREVLETATIRSDWTDEVKLRVMEDLLRQKFDGRDPFLQQRLLDTKGIELI